MIGMNGWDTIADDFRGTLSGVEVVVTFEVPSVELMSPAGTGGLSLCACCWAVPQSIGKGQTGPKSCDACGRVPLLGAFVAGHARQ